MTQIRLLIRRSRLENKCDIFIFVRFFMNLLRCRASCVVQPRMQAELKILHKCNLNLFIYQFTAEAILSMAQMSHPSHICVLSFHRASVSCTYLFLPDNEILLDLEAGMVRLITALDGLD